MMALPWWQNRKGMLPPMTSENPRLLRDAPALRALSQSLKASGKTVVTTNGCFDLLHGGHIYILRSAAAQGDVLIVGLNSDASVRANKGPGRPVLSEDERAAVLLALEPVDYVYVYDEPTCVPFVEAVGPDVHVNDADYGEDCVEAPAVARAGGRLHLIHKRPGPSTTALIGRAGGGKT